MVKEAMAEGGKFHSPNGLPVGSIDRDGNMWECEHGDHPDYKFPVDLDYVGDDVEQEFRVVNGEGDTVDMGAEWYEASRHRQHALIYTDGHIALSMYECGYVMWSLADGMILRAPSWHCSKWQLTKESLEKVRALAALRQ